MHKRDIRNFASRRNLIMRFLFSVLRSVDRGTRIPKGVGDSYVQERFRNRKITPPEVGPAYAKVMHEVKPEELINIGHAVDGHWSIDGGPAIGDSVLCLSVIKILGEMGGAVMLSGLELTPAQIEEGFESLQTEPIRPGKTVRLFMGENLNGQTCYVEVECINP